ncbi:MAG: prepilin-type N-terminal cleavage/methylation domain-containing protein [Marinobacterium sp.]|nr:prepilin-type N-terminal cleavage/methylation domain-containing protein [Marinobacterium sp.]
MNQSVITQSRPLSRVKYDIQYGFTLLERGFTLLELLIALSLTSLLLGVLYQGLQQSLQQWQRTGALTQERLYQYRLQQHFYQQLAQALPLYSRQHVLFAGQSDTLNFISVLEHPARSGLYHYQLYGSPLRLTLWPYQPDVAHTDNPAQPVTGNSDSTESRDAVTKAISTEGYTAGIDAAEAHTTETPNAQEHYPLTGIARFSYGKQQHDGTIIWHNEWLAQRQLPALVRIHHNGQTHVVKLRQRYRVH